MIGKILKTEFISVARAAFLIGGLSLLGKLFALARNKILAEKFGAGATLDTYYAAFLVPDFIYQLFIMGLLSAVFIPIFSQYFQKDKSEAWRFTNAALNALIVIVLAFSVILYFILPYILPFFIPGFSEAMKQEAITVSRIMLLSPIFLGISGVFGSIVQSFKRYIYYSLAPILYNMGIIMGAVFLSGFNARGLAVGVILGAIFHLLIQAAGAFASGFRYEIIFDFWHKGVLKMARLSVARFLSIASTQISIIVLTAIASSIAVGSITIFNFANDLQFVPVGIIALSYAVAVFPKLSEAMAKNDKKSFVFEFSETFGQILFFILPLSVLFFVLRDHIVNVVFGNLKGEHLIAGALGLFTIGIFAQGLLSLLNKSFYALQNTFIPFLTDLFSIVVTIGGGLIFVEMLKNQGLFFDILSGFLGLNYSEGFAILGLPLAFSLGITLNCLITLIFLKRMIGELDSKELLKEAGKMMIAAVLMGVAIIFLLDYLAIKKDGGILRELMVIFLATGVGILIYLPLLKIFKAKEYIFFKKIAGQVFKKLRLIKQDMPENIDTLTR